MEISCDAIKNVCGIYLIRNKINNKIYIGQSVNIYRRWTEHLRAGQPQKYSMKSIRDSKTPIHLAMQKYGINNFEIQLLEKCNKENLDIREQYWIKILKSNDNNIGYNIANGGQKNFILKGEEHSQAKLNQQEVNEIINLLKTTNLTLSEISKKYHNISNSTLCMINTGKSWYNPDLKYPIRKTYTGSRGSKNPKAKFTEEQVLEIRRLYSKGKTLKDIPLKYKKIASDSAILAIMYNKTYKHLPMWDKHKQKWIEPCIDYSQS